MSAYNEVNGKYACLLYTSRVVQLIKRYLKSGVMEDGVVVDTEEGSPQGGNLSPLVANVYPVSYTHLDVYKRQKLSYGHR